MNKEEAVKRLDILCREYNEISTQLFLLDAQGAKDNVPIQPPSSSKNILHDPTVEKLKLENKEQKKEIKFLKDQLKRCNEQLNRYFEQEGELPCLTYRGGLDDAEVTRQSVYKLQGLLRAYDEVIKEQETTIQY